jgi:4-oxalomesaconate tautomerase
MCGALLPTGNAVDHIDGIEATLIDNGMPCVVMRAGDLGVAGTESREELEANGALRTRIEAIRLAAGPMMNLGDVTGKSVPKMTLDSPRQDGGTVATRSFIPHRCHATIGVFAAVGVACLHLAGFAGSVGRGPARGQNLRDRASHRLRGGTDRARRGGTVTSASTLRTARKLFDGLVYPGG